jgi:hypothetical protein
MEEIDELIKKYKLSQDSEHVIIPLPDKNGRKRRCFLLKREFIRIVYSEELYVDYPLADAIEATVKYPDLLLSQSLILIYNERGTDARLHLKPPEQTSQADN